MCGAGSVRRARCVECNAPRASQSEHSLPVRIMLTSYATFYADFRIGALHYVAQITSHHYCVTRYTKATAGSDDEGLDDHSDNEKQDDGMELSGQQQQQQQHQHGIDGNGMGEESAADAPKGKRSTSSTGAGADSSVAGGNGGGDGSGAVDSAIVGGAGAGAGAAASPRRTSNGEKARREKRLSGPKSTRSPASQRRGSSGTPAASPARPVSTHPR